MPLKTEPFDPAEYLTTPEAWAYLINDALATADTGYIADAIGIVARAIGMAEVAPKAGIAHEAISKSPTEAGDPRLSTLLEVTSALGMTLSLHPATSDSIAPMTGD